MWLHVLDQSHRFEVKCKIDAEAFGEGIWGLGMAFEETLVGGRKKVAIQGFRVGEDDNGREVQSPGLLAGLKVGDTIIKVDGIDLVGGMKELKLEVKDSQHLGEVTLLVDRVYVKGRYVPPQPKVHANGVYPEITKFVVQRKPGQSLGVNLSEIYGSGNEGYGLDKAYLLVNNVVAGSPAEQAGVKVDDSIISVNGTMVFNIEELKGRLGGANKIELIVVRMRDNTAGGSFRQSNVVDIPINLDPAGMGGVGLGARIIEVSSGLGVDSSVPYVCLVDFGLLPLPRWSAVCFFVRISLLVLTFYFFSVTLHCVVQVFDGVRIKCVWQRPTRSSCAGRGQTVRLGADGEQHAGALVETSRHCPQGRPSAASVHGTALDV